MLSIQLNSSLKEEFFFLEFSHWDCKNTKKKKKPKLEFFFFNFVLAFLLSQGGKSPTVLSDGLKQIGSRLSLSRYAMRLGGMVHMTEAMLTPRNKSEDTVLELLSHAQVIFALFHSRVNLKNELEGHDPIS